MKYLVVGLGNIGYEYKNTRHNIGFDVLDAFAKASNAVFSDVKLGSVCECKHKGRTFVLLKPNTYVNLSGKSLNYWMQKEKIPIDHVIVVLDDLALPYGTIRLKGKGGDAGHNGLKNINQVLGHNKYARLRFGIGDDFRRGKQVDFVLGKWTDEEKEWMPNYVEKAIETIKSFGTIGLERTMNFFNTKDK